MEADGTLSSAAAALYEHITAQGGVERSEVEAQPLAELERWGLVLGVENRLIPIAPDEAVHRRAADLEARAEEVRRSGADLAETWRRHQSTPDVELVRSDEITPVLDALVRNAVVSVDGTAVPNSGVAEPPEAAPGQDEAMARGVRVRGIYGAEVLDHPAGMALIRECVAWGEEARLLPKIPVLINLVDNQVAAVVPFYENHAARQMFLFRAPGMVAVWREVFEHLWAQAIPAEFGGGPAGPDMGEDQQLLVLLAGGMSDRAVARELGISERTLSRRLTVLSQRYGAQSRFQLGFQAARRLSAPTPLDRPES